MAQVNLTLAHVHSELSVGQMDGIGWDGWMVIIGGRYSKSTFGANKNHNIYQIPKLKNIDDRGNVVPR